MQKRTLTLLTALIALLIFAACATPTPGQGTGSPAAAPAPAEPTAPPAPEADAEADAEEDAQNPESSDEEATDTDSDTSAADAAVSGTRTFIISAAESEAAYLVDEELFADALTKYGLTPGPNPVRGTTQEIEGRFTLNFDDLSSALGENRFTVDMTTLSTDQFLRDGWLRSDGPRFNQFPVAEFIASEIQGAPESYTPGEEVTFQLVGELTIREITHPKTFVVTARLENDTITGTATTDALLTEYGIDPPDFFNTLTVADPFSIEINFVAHAE